MRLVVLIAFCMGILLATEELLEQGEFFQKLFTNLFEKKPIHIYIVQSNYRSIFHKPDFQVVKECNKSDFVFGGKVCPKKLHFVLDYKTFREDPLAFGAFYWRKGRPQLIFRRELLEKINPKATQWLKIYLED